MNLAIWLPGMFVLGVLSTVLYIRFSMHAKKI